MGSGSVRYHFHRGKDPMLNKLRELSNINPSTSFLIYMAAVSKIVLGIVKKSNFCEKKRPFV